MKLRFPLLAILSLAPVALFAWGDYGHRAISQLALSSLPGDFPPFVKATA